MQQLFNVPTISIMGSFHSIHNVVDRGVLQAMWEELAGAKLDVACLLTTPI